jgi:hypothetical protein
MLADRRHCYPLTISDFASRFLFAVEALQSTKESTAITVFERGVRPATSDQDRQWCTLHLAQCALQSLEALGLVA